jgi:AraC family transcriptional regulator of adaptative response / DNA-3-methyladenine glycosylase II
VGLQLQYRAPLDHAALIRFFDARAVPGVEEVVGGVYRRSVRLAGGPAVIELGPANGHVTARLRLSDPGDWPAARRLSRRLLDLAADPEEVGTALGSDPLIGELVRANPGRRLPGHPDPAELAIRAVIGQQVSVAAAATIAGRLVAALGEPLPRPVGGVTHLFPQPCALAAVSPDELPMPGSRALALIGLATALASGELVLDPEADPAVTRERLVGLPGIGPWTAEYVAMRGLGDRDAFLPTDLGVRRALERLGEDSRPAAAERLAERWRPYRAYALSHLWSTLN